MCILYCVGRKPFSGYPLAIKSNYSKMISQISLVKCETIANASNNSGLFSRSVRKYTNLFAKNKKAGGKVFRCLSAQSENGSMKMEWG